MGRKKKRKLAQPFCYYCDRKFEDENVLVQHQMSRHFKCKECYKKLATAKSLNLHMQGVHHCRLATVPNAKEGRESVDIEIYGMEGVPDDIIKQMGGVPDTNDKKQKTESESAGPNSNTVPQTPQQAQQEFTEKAHLLAAQYSTTGVATPSFPGNPMFMPGQQPTPGYNNMMTPQQQPQQQSMSFPLPTPSYPVASYQHAHGLFPNPSFPPNHPPRYPPAGIPHWQGQNIPQPGQNFPPAQNRPMMPGMAPQWNAAMAPNVTGVNMSGPGNIAGVQQQIRPVQASIIAAARAAVQQQPSSSQPISTQAFAQAAPSSRGEANPYALPPSPDLAAAPSMLASQSISSTTVDSGLTNLPPKLILVFANEDDSMEEIRAQAMLSR